MERKSFELHLQSANWVGGIAAAAAGGVLLALLNEGTPASLVVWLRIIGVVLLVALGASAYTQLHAVAMISANEKAASVTDEEEKEEWNQLGLTRRKFTQWSQNTMVYSLLLAAFLLILGLIFYEPKPEPESQWTVVSVSATGGDPVVVMTKPGTGAVRILSRRAADTAWSVDEVAVDGELPKPAPDGAEASP